MDVTPDEFDRFTENNRICFHTGSPKVSVLSYLWIKTSDCILILTIKAIQWQVQLISVHTFCVSQVTVIIIITEIWYVRILEILTSIWLLGLICLKDRKSRFAIIPIIGPVINLFLLGSRYFRSWTYIYNMEKDNLVNFSFFETILQKFIISFKKFPHKQ